MATSNFVQTSNFARPYFASFNLVAAVASALAFFAPVAQAAVEQPEKAHYAEAPVAKHLREHIDQALHKAKQCADVFERACVKISNAPAGGVADHQNFATIAHVLRDKEAQLDEAIAGLDKSTAEQYGLIQLRRAVARARSKAATAELLAKQTTITPQSVDMLSDSAALSALADHMTSGIGAHLHGEEASRS
ncbi:MULTISPECIES: hypothetical protein [Cobetia]|uniref:hypothetical protein n=1 Tax=Cobetia TaxID=204286 RepID=UPI001582A763|nr:MULTISPECIES: hypothetical protein [Cobetia]MDI4659570.1 hypothetical protein [Cobetia sp. BMC6]NUJ56118.1 hypothetical protein [Cobetia marina]